MVRPASCQFVIFVCRPFVVVLSDYLLSQICLTITGAVATSFRSGPLAIIIDDRAELGSDLRTTATVR